MNAAVALSERVSALSLDASLDREVVEGVVEMLGALAEPEWLTSCSWTELRSSRRLLNLGGGCVISLESALCGITACEDFSRPDVLALRCQHQYQRVVWKLGCGGSDSGSSDRFHVRTSSLQSEFIYITSPTQYKYRSTLKHPRD